MLEDHRLIPKVQAYHKLMHSFTVLPEPVNGPGQVAVRPVLVFGYGNPSRGDDALGPFLLDRIDPDLSSQKIEILTDFQLQVEHSLDLEYRELVLFIDASVTGENVFSFYELKPARDSSYTTHAVSPSAVLAVYQDIKNQAPPPCFLLSIKGESFELGDGLSTNAKIHLEQASLFVEQLVKEPDVKKWRELTNNA